MILTPRGLYSLSLFRHKTEEQTISTENLTEKLQN